MSSFCSSWAIWNGYHAGHPGEIIHSEPSSLRHRDHSNTLNRRNLYGRYASFTPPSAIQALVRAVNPVPNVAPSWSAPLRVDRTGDFELTLPVGLPED